MVSPVLATAHRHHQAGELCQALHLYQEILQEDPENAAVWCLAAEASQALGRRDEAAAGYQESLVRHPDNSVAHNNLGIVLMEQGQLDEAIAAYRRALALQPVYPEACNNLGIALMDQGKLEEAIVSYRRALQLRPDYAEAWNNLGNAQVRLHQFEEAVASYRRAIQLKPDYLLAQANLGIELRRLGRLEEAAAVYQQALSCHPGHVPFHLELGVVLLEQGKLSEAVACFRQVLLLNPDHAEAYNNLGIVRLNQGHRAEAVALFCQAIYLKPDYPEAHNNLGNALANQGKAEEAAATYRQAIALRPDYAEAHHNLGLVLASQGKVDEALASYEEAVRIRPYAEALNNLANTCKDQGRLDEAIACYRQAVATKPQEASIHSNLLYALLYSARSRPEDIFAEQQAWTRQHGSGLASASQCHAGTADPERRLRIGYVSPDFREHVMGRFSEAVVRSHDRERFEVFCYADVSRPDALTRRIQVSADQWRPLTGLSDDRAADLIRQDRIDILIDLAGHTGGNRLRLFARKPAPIQMTHFGYIGTTGLETIDYRLTDAHTDPPGLTEAYFTEKLLRLPEVLWCYPPPPSPEVGPLPAVQAGRVTFGSFNNLCKVTEEIIALWAQILTALPEARMVLLAGAGRAGDERVRSAFARGGIGPDRVTLLGRQSRDAYFQLYQGVDVCLDTFPFSGCNTTADALWMGVPVVTLAGPTCVSRQGVATLVHAGLGQLVTESAAAYVETAIGLARDISWLRELRSGLRERIKRSPLLDVPGFTHHLEEAYRWAWRQWCAGTGTSVS